MFAICYNLMKINTRLKRALSHFCLGEYSMDSLRALEGKLYNSILGNHESNMEDINFSTVTRNT